MAANMTRSELADKLHAEIMNLMCDPEDCGVRGVPAMLAYKQGHRDARHAAAELVSDFTAAIDQLAANQAEGWQPISSAPEGVRVLLGPRDAPVVGTVSHPAPWEEGDLSCCVVHYNGNILVAGYHCSEWHHLPASPPIPSNGGAGEAL